jgi:hypothetical protein
MRHPIFTIYSTILQYIAIVDIDKNNEYIAIVDVVFYFNNIRQYIGLDSWVGGVVATPDTRQTPKSEGNQQGRGGTHDAAKTS